MTKKCKVFVSVPSNTEVFRTFIAPEVQSYLEERFEVSYLPLDRKLVKEEIAEYAADADVIITGWAHCLMDAECLKDTSVKLIVHTGGSVGGVVTPDVYDAGIRVISGNDMYADSVAEGVLAYILTLVRKIPDYCNSVREGNWQPRGLITEGLLDQTVGIVGMGAISRRVIKLLQPFNVKVKIYSGHPVEESFLREYNAQQVSLEEVFASCKIVSLHSAMNERTKGMIRKKHFDLLQDGSFFLNTARGKLINEEEMIEALKENRFRALLDVYHKEPLPSDSLLRSLPNVYCMPHVAGPTIDRRPMVTMRLADDILRFVNEDPLRMEISKEYAARMTVVVR